MFFGHVVQGVDEDEFEGDAGLVALVARGVEAFEGGLLPAANGKPAALQAGEARTHRLRNTGAVLGHRVADGLEQLRRLGFGELPVAGEPFGEEGAVPFRVFAAGAYRDGGRVLFHEVVGALEVGVHLFGVGAALGAAEGHLTQRHEHRFDAVVEQHRQLRVLALQGLGGMLGKDDEAEGGNALVVEGITEEKLDLFHNRLIYRFKNKRQSLAVFGTGSYGPGPGILGCPSTGWNRTLNGLGGYSTGWNKTLNELGGHSITCTWTLNGLGGHSITCTSILNELGGHATGWNPMLNGLRCRSTFGAITCNPFGSAFFREAINRKTRGRWIPGKSGGVLQLVCWFWKDGRIGYPEATEGF